MLGIRVLRPAIGATRIGFVHVVPQISPNKLGRGLQSHPNDLCHSVSDKIQTLIYCSRSYLSSIEAQDPMFLCPLSAASATKASAENPPSALPKSNKSYARTLSVSRFKIVLVNHFCTKGREKRIVHMKLYLFLALPS